MIVRKLVLSLLSAQTAAAALLSVAIQATQQLPNPSSLAASTHAVLLGEPGVRYDVPLRKDNLFVFPNLDDGSYLLTIHSREHFFPPLRVDIEEEEETPGSPQVISAWQTFRGNAWDNKGPSYGSAQGALTVQVRPGVAKEYYQERGGFSLISFLKSPMILMSLVSVLLIFGLPMMMDNMDEETKKEFDEMSRKQPITGSNGAASQVQNFDLAGWLSSKSSGTSTPPVSGSDGKTR